MNCIANQLNIMYRLEKICFKMIFKSIVRNTTTSVHEREFHNLGAQERTLSPYKENVFGVLRRSLCDDLRVCVCTQGVRNWII